MDADDRGMKKGRIEKNKLFAAGYTIILICRLGRYSTDHSQNDVSDG